MIERRPSNQLAAADPGAPMTMQRSVSGDYWTTKRSLIACLALALLGGAATSTAVAMVAYLILANSHI